MATSSRSTATSTGTAGSRRTPRWTPSSPATARPCCCAPRPVSAPASCPTPTCGAGSGCPGRAPRRSRWTWRSTRGSRSIPAPRGADQGAEAGAGIGRSGMPAALQMLEVAAGGVQPFALRRSAPRWAAAASSGWATADPTGRARRADAGRARTPVMWSPPRLLGGTLGGRGHRGRTLPRPARLASRRTPSSRPACLGEVGGDPPGRGRASCCPGPFARFSAFAGSGGPSW